MNSTACCGAVALVASAAMVATTIGAGQDRPTFRAGVDLVTVDVTVRDGNRSVRGLSAEDFVLTDNGVPQTIDVVLTASLPIDVTIALDVSGSMAPLIDPIKAQARQAASLLGRDDRMRLLTFGDRVEVAAEFGAADVSATSISTTAALGGTRLYDGLAAALVTPRAGDRRHLVVAYTDGWDTLSAIGHADLETIARRSEAVLQIFVVMAAPEDPTPSAGAVSTLMRLDTRRRWRPPFDTTMWRPAEIARLTGGGFDRVLARSAASATLRRVLAEFREGYVIRYRAHGVAEPGWHQIAVTTRRPGRLEVRARAGYEARGSGLALR